MIKKRIKRTYLFFRPYMTASKYLPGFFFMRHTEIPAALKIFSCLTAQKPLAHFKESSSVLMLSADSRVIERKRKLMVVDESQKVVFHIFNNPYDQKKYKKNRDAFVASMQFKPFSFPMYKCVEEKSECLAVAEQMVQGVSLQALEQKGVERFIETWLGGFNNSFFPLNEKEDQRLLYSQLRDWRIRLQRLLGPSSSFSRLYEFCGKPLENEGGVWPITYCHGQTVPVNILHNPDEEKYYFIDYEPKYMGLGPFGYDFIFFLLYSENIISDNFKYQLKRCLHHDMVNLSWASAFLSQIIWWCRDKSELNSDRMEKIENRSRFALSLLGGVSGYGK